MLVPANGNLTLLELVAHLHKQYYKYCIGLYLILLHMQQTIQSPPLELYTFTRRIIKRQILRFTTSNLQWVTVPKRLEAQLQKTVYLW